MIAVGLFLLATALSLIIRVPGQMRSLPERLVVEGPYRWIRHPIYLSHFFLIGGSALAFGALKVFLETPVLLGMAAIGAKYEESRRLLPLFGKTFEQYKAKTLPSSADLGLGCTWIHLQFGGFVRVSFLSRRRGHSLTIFYPNCRGSLLSGKKRTYGRR